MLLVLPWPAHLARAPSLLTLVICCSACGRPSSLFSLASCGAAHVRHRWWLASNVFFFVLLCGVLMCFREWGWSLLRVKAIRKIVFLFTHFFVVGGWCRVGANSGYTRGYQTILHAACLVRRLYTLL